MTQDTPAKEETMNATFQSKITISTQYAPPKIYNTLAARECTNASNCTDTSRVFQTDYIENTTKIVFQNEMVAPTEYIASFDESESKDGSVKAYVVANEEDPSTYTIHFQTTGNFNMPPDSSYYFSYFQKVTSVEGLEYVDTKNVTSMASMFYDMRNPISVDVSNFDTSSVTNMAFMFGNDGSVSSAPVLQELDLSNFNTYNVTSMRYMFSGQRNITKLNISSFDTSNVTNMAGMFRGVSTSTMNLSSFNTSKVTSMGQMFYQSPNLSNLDLSSFDTSKVTSMYWMFASTPSLTSITYGPNFIYANSANIEDMFLDSPVNKPTDPSWEGVL